MTDKYLKIPELMDIASIFYGIPWRVRKRFVKPSYFRFNDREYAYFSHPYNGTWMNERAVEIPLIWEQVCSYSPSVVLEVGNVLSHYFPVSHLIVDKYERKPGVIPKDILSVEFPEKFQCIVSISTLEHIGWDESPRVHAKHIQAVSKMRELLAADGKLLATIPLGYNPSLDDDLFNERLDCHQVYYFRRLKYDRWIEASLDEVRDSRYGEKYRSTDGLAFCVWHG